MSKEDDYRRNAAETLALAGRTRDFRDKGRLLSLAEKWLDLAERSRAARNRIGRLRLVHPLVREKIPDLGRDGP